MMSRSMTFTLATYGLSIISLYVRPTNNLIETVRQQLQQSHRNRLFLGPRGDEDVFQKIKKAGDRISGM